jgi:hypothetical protein
LVPGTPIDGTAILFWWSLICACRLCCAGWVSLCGAQAGSQRQRSRVAVAQVPGDRFAGTTAWITADRAKPRIRER